MNIAVCRLDGCDLPYEAKGLCRSHYMRLRRHGPDMDTSPIKTSPPDCLDWIVAHMNHADLDCLDWPFYKTRAGYGCFYDRGARVKAHRVMCELAHGTQASDDLVVAHSCGRRICVNPNHVRWATQRENLADMDIHGTRLRGHMHPASRLTAGDVREVRMDARRLWVIAKEYGVSESTISEIKNRKRYTNV